MSIPPPARSVLIVEDEGIVAYDIQLTLKSLGYDAYAIATCAAEALQLATERCPDIVLIDIQIQGETDGIDTAELLKQRFDVPVVFLTAHADAPTLERATRIEPTGYLVKPVRTADLRTAIEVSLYKHEMDKRLRARERWYATTLHSIADAVITVDLAGRVTFMNQPAEAIVGVAAVDAVGKHADEVLRIAYDRLSPPQETPLMSALRENRVVELPEAQLQNRATGAMRTISDSAAPLSSDGDVQGAVMVFRDITERRQLEAQLELTGQLASLGTLAAGVALEVNNPLSVVTANAAYVAEQLELWKTGQAQAALSPQQAAFFEEMRVVVTEMRSAAARITRIVSDLRVFSQPPAPADGLVDVVECVDWAIRATSREVTPRARLITALSPVPAVAGDQTKLGQVLVNLLVNAAQAIAPGQAERNEVAVSTYAEPPDWVRIEVRDTGVGIPKANLNRVFDPFFTTKGPGVGTGLGLSISHGIVAAFGGELRVTSEPGRGTRFIVRLPAAKTEVTPSRPPSSRLGPFLRGRLLVLDDEEAVLRVLGRVLRAHELVCVDNAREALRQIAEGERFDLVFTDISMPTITGIQFYETVLERDPDLASRIVFLCGGTTSAAAADFLRTVANPRIEKPFDVEHLQQLIQDLLGRDAGTSEGK